MKTKKIIILTAIMTIIMPFFLTLIQGINVKANSANIQYLGTVTYGGTTVGSFAINGVLAFCFEHQKTTPPSNTANDGGSIYDDPRIAGALYHGWGGPANMFTNFNQGVVVTSLLVSRYYSGDTSGSNLPGYAELRYRAENIGAPNGQDISFSKTNVDTFMTGDRQRSEDITFHGDSRNLISYTVPNGVTFHNISTGYTQTGGTVTIAGGETFYLSASLTYNQHFYSGGLKGSFGKFAPILYITTGNVQNLGRGDWFEDPEKSISFQVNFRQFTRTVTVNHIDRVSNEVLRSDKVDVPIGDTVTFYPRYDFKKEDNLYKVLDIAKTIVVNNDETVNFYYDPPIKINLIHRDARLPNDKNVITTETVIKYPNDEYYFKHRDDLKKGKYKYRPTSDNYYTGKVGTQDFSLDFFYDSPLVDIGMNTLRIYTEEASVGLPVELVLDKATLYDETTPDLGTGEVEVNLYDGKKLLESRTYSALNLPEKLTWTIDPEHLEVNDSKAYTVNFENFNSNDFYIESNKNAITTDGYTATEEEVIVSDQEASKLAYEAVIMTEKQIEKKDMIIKKESFEIPINNIKRMRTGYGFENKLDLTYDNELNSTLTGYEDGFSLKTPVEIFDATHLEYVTDAESAYTPLDNTVDEYTNEDKSKTTHKLTFDLPHMNVERKTGALFSDEQVANNDSRITRELRDGKRKFYLPFWIDLDTYEVNQISNGRLGVNKIKTTIKQDVEVFAYMYAHIGSPSIKDDAILMIPVDGENPFGGKIPDGWTQSDIDWIKSDGGINKK